MSIGIEHQPITPSTIRIIPAKIKNAFGMLKIAAKHKIMPIIILLDLSTLSILHLLLYIFS